MPKRNRKKFSRPRKPFDKPRIEEENVLKEKYGLKSKREIWKADAAIARIRNLAKNLITKSEEEKALFVERLQKKGFNVNNIAESLALNKEDWLKRRLQTLVHSRGLTTTAKQARQLITHKHVSIGDQTVNIPSYQVSLEEEPSIKLNIVLKIKELKKSKEEMIKEEVLEGIENPEEVLIEEEIQ
jgi:small subunit ribosomal protein S4